MAWSSVPAAAPHALSTLPSIFWLNKLDGSESLRIEILFGSVEQVFMPKAFEAIASAVEITSSSSCSPRLYRGDTMCSYPPI